MLWRDGDGERKEGRRERGRDGESERGERKRKGEGEAEGGVMLLEIMMVLYLQSLPTWLLHHSV